MNKAIAKNLKKIQFLQRIDTIVYYILSIIFCFVIKFCAFPSNIIRYFRGDKKQSVNTLKLLH